MKILVKVKILMIVKMIIVKSLLLLQSGQTTQFLHNMDYFILRLPL